MNELSIISLRSSGLYSFFRDCTFFKSLQLFEEGREIYEISRFKEKKFFSGRHKLWRPPVTFQWQLNTFYSVQNYLFSKFPFVFTNIFWVVATTCGDHWKFFFSLNDLFSKFSLLLQKLAGSWKMCSPGKLNICWTMSMCMATKWMNEWVVQNPSFFLLLFWGWGVG